MNTPSLLRATVILLAAALTACATPQSQPARTTGAAVAPSNQVDEFSRRVQAAMNNGELETRSVTIHTPAGRTRTITPTGWTDS